MSSLIDYAALETSSFSARPFGSEDSMVLSQLAYLRFDGFITEPSAFSRSLTIGAAAAPGRIEKLTAGINGADAMRDLLEALAINPRFMNVKIKYYSNRFSSSAQKQFSAVTFLLGDMSAYIAIRGTDSSLVGWRENLMMAYEYPIPAQEEAAYYLERVSKLTARRLRIGGHSKGGNLAMYAAMNATERTMSKIMDIYSLDGPGFAESVLDTPEYNKIKGRVHKILPTDSFIGTLLRQGEDFSVVKSSAKGLGQHDLFSWLMEDNHLVYAPSLNPNAVRFDLTLDRWLAGMSSGRRKEVVSLVFILMDRTKADDLKSLFNYYETDDSRLASAIFDFEPQQKRMLLRELANLAGAFLGTAISMHGVVYNT